jgi:Na+-transporting methylmalonyl-CoA/oxaloacetate decarboxylase beta subunit
VPGSAREVHLMGLKEDPTNFLLMHGMACNSSGFERGPDELFADAWNGV